MPLSPPAGPHGKKVELRAKRDQLNRQTRASHRDLHGTMFFAAWCRQLVLAHRLMGSWSSCAALRRSVLGQRMTIFSRRGSWEWALSCRSGVRLTNAASVIGRGGTSAPKTPGRASCHLEMQPGAFGGLPASQAPGDRTTVLLLDPPAAVVMVSTQRINPGVSDETHHFL
jgi:hypothetical protein